MAGYIGSKAVNLSTTGADINGDANIDGDLSFRDNDKIKLGAGSDLQIYHDGSNSWIKDEGTGVLAITTNGNGIGFYDPTGTEPMLFATKDNAVDLYFNGAKKLATTSTGIDVTGTVTADGLTVDLGNTTDVTVNGTDGGGIQFNYGGVNQVRIDSASNDGGVYHTPTGKNHTFKTDGANRLKIATGGDISFYEDTGTTAKFFWDASAESLSIGSPSADNVTIYSTDDVPRLEFEQGGTVYADIGHRGASAGARQNIFEISTKQSEPMAFRTNNTERMRITSSGSVGIGTSSPTDKLTVSGSAAYMTIDRNDGEAGVTFRYNGDNTKRADIATQTNGDLRFRTNLTEAMRIDSSGNLLVGKTSTGIGTAGIQAESTGQLNVTKSGDAAIRAIRLSSDGDIVKFYKDGSTVGSIASSSGTFQLVANTNLTYKANIYTFDNAAGSTEYMRIDSSGNVGIGTASPTNASGYTTANIGAGTVGSIFKMDGATSGFYHRLINNNGDFGIQADQGNVKTATNITFSIDASERMRINSSGRVGIGITSVDARLHVQGQAGNDTAIFRNGSDANNGISIQRTDGTEVGSINWASSSTSFNTSSDYRLKENVIELTGATARLKLLEPKRFNFISDADTTVDGFLAHEVQAIVPEAITGTHNEVDADGNPVYQGIDQSKLVPLLVATLQEALDEITDLKARVATLEAN